MTEWASEHKDPLLKFAAKPTFEETFDVESGSLTLANKEWTYRAATIKADDAAKLTRYREFTDRYAELSAMMFNPPAWSSSGARRRVRQAWRRAGGDQTDARRRRKEHREGDPHVLLEPRAQRSQRLDEAQAHLANFKKVDNEQFIAAKTGKDVVRGQSK